MYFYIKPINFAHVTIKNVHIRSKIAENDYEYWRLTIYLKIFKNKIYENKQCNS